MEHGVTVNIDPPEKVKLSESDRSDYHKGRPSRPTAIPLEQRKFIAWDGEGINLSGEGKPQSYVLFGCSTGDKIIAPGIHTFDLLDFIVEIGIKHPDAFHIGFAFGYDSNMIIKSLNESNLSYLHKNGFVKLKRPNGDRFCITYRKGKSFTVSRYKSQHNRAKNSYAKHTVRIYDVFSFFTTSFINAVEKLLGNEAEGLDIVREGKALRNDFTYDQIDYITKYWLAEIKLLSALAEELRRNLYGAGLRIKDWHGPGALASYVLNQNKIKQHMMRNNDEIRLASRYAYAGGRFEPYKVGRVLGPVYGIDINSAYPYGITQLPSLTEGEWVHESNPKRIAKFGIYHVVLNHSVGFAKPPGPLFHRDEYHNLSYPWLTDGWYWSPEVIGLIHSSKVHILEGWHYIGSKTKPFEWVRDMYNTRQEWKRKGFSSELALKLCMNSLYGKMAQRVGWDEKNNRIPPWHQLEWAGWVTANTRATLYDVMKQIPWKDLIAVETDGIYTTYDPAKLDIKVSKELGEWDITEYEEVIYVQSGLAWLKSAKGWEDKRRGLDANTFTLQQCQEYIQTLEANTIWKPFMGKSSRFITLGQALNSEAPTKVKHCVWETNDREISPGETGKRIHLPTNCSACESGHSAWEKPHDLVIRSLTQIDVMSVPHSIPWEDKDDEQVEWRQYAEANN